MRQAFVFERFAVLVGPCRVPLEPPEHGARVEVRVLAEEEPPASRRVALPVVLDRPIFRADLFDRADLPPGNFAAAHFHPTFKGFEPCYRQWDEAVQRDPIEWLTTELADLRGVVERSGIDVGSAAARLDADAAALRAALPEVANAVDAACRSAWDGGNTQ